MAVDEVDVDTVASDSGDLGGGGGDGERPVLSMMSVDRSRIETLKLERVVRERKKKEVPVE